MTIQVKINLDMHPTSLDLVFPDGIQEGGRVRLKLHRASSRFTYLNERERVPVVRQNKCVLDSRYLEENIVLDDASHEDDGHPLCLLKPISDACEKTDHADSTANGIPNEASPHSLVETPCPSPADYDIPDDDIHNSEDENCAPQEPSESSISAGPIAVYVCTVCGYQTKDKERAIQHMRAHCTGEPSTPSVRKKKQRKLDILPQETDESGEKIFRCAECSKQFQAEGLLRIHTRVYHRGVIECSLCTTEASNDRDLEKHMISEHAEAAPLKCSVCHAPHFNPEILKSHELWCSTLGKLKKNLKCQLCNFNTIQYDALCQHVKDSHPGKVVYTCEVCGSLSLDAKLHQEHLRTHTRQAETPVEGGYQCPVCRKTLANKRGLRLHLKRHPISFIHICETCGDHFQTQPDLMKHVELCHKPVTRRYQCRFCKKIFKTSFSVKRHMKNVHGYERASKSVPWDYITLVATKQREGETQELGKPPKLVEKKTRARRPHRCELCAFETNNLGRFERHQALHTGIYHYPCPECPRKFAAKTELKKHGQIAHPKNLLTCAHCPRLFETKETSAYEAHLEQHSAGKTRPCQECSHHFADAEELQAHRDQLHSPSLPVECRLCHQRFRLVSHRVNHVRRYHPNVLQRPHICDICGWAYRYQSGLSVHKLERHSNRTGDKTYECNYCGKVFGRGNILALHLRLHTGESPYLCRDCGVTFRTPTGLKYHTVNVHTKEYSVFCQICSKGFVSKRKLKVHLIRTHKAQNVDQQIANTQRAPPVFIERATVPVVSAETGDDSMLDVMQIIDTNEMKTRQLETAVHVIDFSDMDVSQTPTVECYTEV